MPMALRKILSPRFVRQSIDRWAARPFGRLVRQFLARTASGSNASADSDLDLGIGGLLGLLATPGAFTCFLLLDKYSTFLNWYRGRRHIDIYLVSLSDKYLFIALAMAVTGIVTVLKWDKILPDSQDYLNLAPLPVRRRTILLANADSHRHRGAGVRHRRERRPLRSLPAIRQFLRRDSAWPISCGSPAPI